MRWRRWRWSGWRWGGEGTPKGRPLTASLDAKGCLPSREGMSSLHAKGCPPTEGDFLMILDVSSTPHITHRRSHICGKGTQKSLDAAPSR